MHARPPHKPAEGENVHLECIHCGLCLAACPTYHHLGNEADSPRGRLYLIRALQEGRVSAGSRMFQRHMQLCLECRACETACPSGVRFISIMNGARIEIRKHRGISGIGSLARRLMLEKVLPSRRILRLAFGALRFYQRCGLQRFLRSPGVVKRMPRRLAIMEALLPEIPRRFAHGVSDVASPEPGRRALLFEGCIMPELFGPIHEATMRVLARNGVSVAVPSRQACCGALQLHDGDVETARRLARSNIDAFEKAGQGEIIVNAAGCGAMLKEYGVLLADDPVYAQRAQTLSLRVRDVCEYLDAIGIDGDLKRLDRRVAVDDPCHLVHGQRIREAPRRLLREIPGLELVELNEADRCCGSAGIYNIMEPDMADRILDDKIANIVRTGASIVASGNPGCLLQIQAGLRAKKMDVRVAHPVEILDESYRKM